MNSQECRTLTATCVHDSRSIAWLTVYIPVQYQATSPASEQGSGTIELHTLHLNRVLVLTYT